MYKIITILVIFWLCVIAAIIYANPFGFYLSKDAKALIKDIEYAPLAENGHVYYIGLTAPRHVDPKKFGDALYNQKIDWEAWADDDEKADVDFSVDGKPQIKFQGNPDTLECWIEQKPDPEKPCASEVELKKLIEQNNIGLNRLRELSGYAIYENNLSFGVETPKTSELFMDLNALLYAQLVYQSQNGQRDQGIQEWIRHITFLQRALAQRNTLVDKAIFMIPYAQSLYVLPLIVQDGSLRQEQVDAVKTVLLQTQKLGYGFNTRQAARGDYHFIIYNMKDSVDNVGQYEAVQTQMLMPLMFNYNDTTNIYAQRISPILEIDKLSGPDFIQAYMNYQEKQGEGKSVYDWVKYIYNFTGRLLIGGVLKGYELMANARRLEGEALMMHVYLDLKQNKVAVNAVGSYLATAVRNPLTDQPFSWDGETQEIYFLNPFSKEEQRRSVYYAPLP